MPIVDLTVGCTSESPSLNAVWRIDVYRESLVKSCPGIEPCFTLGSSTFWKLQNDIQLMLWETKTAIQKLDSCNGIDKQSSRSAAQ